MSSSSFINFATSLYPIVTIAIIKSANESAFHIPLSNNITANIPSVAVIPYIIKTACFWVYPFATSLWCKCPLSGLNTAFNDFPFIILLIIVNKVSNIGIAKIIIGAINTRAVYVLATPRIDIIARENPMKLDPVSPINVFAGLKLNGRNPTIAPAKAVINTIAINGEPFNANTIRSDKHEIKVTPDDNPSRPSIKLIAFVIPIIQHTVIIYENIPLITIFPSVNGIEI